MRFRLLSVILILLPMLVRAQEYIPETSVAGFIPIKDGGRKVYNFNVGWRFMRGDIDGAELRLFDDSSWESVSVPHSVQLEPAEASGGRNYQGKAWYRKHFVVDAALKGRIISLYFEAVMGRTKVYVNGQKALEHLGGYLPFSVTLNDFGVLAGDTCVIALCTDNSNDKSFPPGKTQYTLDFAYHGGVYRDVWMIAKSAVSMTDVIEANKVAGGGVFVHYDNISKKEADVFVDTELKNSSEQSRTVTLKTSLCTKEGKVLKTETTRQTLSAGGVCTVKHSFHVKSPSLWSPKSPYLYRVETQICEGRMVLDDGITRIGIRRAEFRGKDGFWLNGEPYGQLIGVNRHQDFGYVGNALPNSGQWRDAKLLRDGGCEIVRSAHYPQDPAFMDACDEMGIFVIVATPGWQYWNKAPEFGELSLRNTREMIRRDRNHTSVLLWEPILNETRFPFDFSLTALKVTQEEFPYPGAPLAAADVHSAGVADNYGVVYGWPGDDEKTDAPRQCIFTREFGENVDDWYAHNNNNRASRSWGEVPQLIQALSLAQSYGELFRTTGKFIGGAQWHPFDHQRGYHPDPYWGGQFDCFRQPKYAYYMFRSQSPATLNHPFAESGPMVFMAHEMTQFSPSDVTVFSNCDSVRLICYGRDTLVQPVVHAVGAIPNAPVVFKNVWNFWEAREYSYKQKNWQQVHFVVEGIINGKTVCRIKRMPSRRSCHVRLRLADERVPLVADGSDFTVVIAEITDESGFVRRLAKENIVFEVEGEGEIIGDATIGANPRAVEFGSAPLLVRSTTKAGEVRVTAHVQFEGTNAPTADTLVFRSVAYDMPMNYIESECIRATNHKEKEGNGSTVILSEEEKAKLLDEVERQQTDFGVN